MLSVGAGRSGRGSSLFISSRDNDSLMTMDESERYARAKKRVEDIRGFYTHLGIYIIINVLLVIINLLTSPGALWFYWVTLFWGVGIAFHALDVFVGNRIFGSEWEERKIQEMMEKDERKR